MDSLWSKALQRAGLLAALCFNFTPKAAAMTRRNTVKAVSRSRPQRIVRFRRRAILRRFVPHPRKMAKPRRLVLAKASHPRTNRRGRLVPLRGIRIRVQFPQTRRSARPFQAPRTRLRLEAAYGGRCCRAARCVPGTAIGPGSKFRPDRCRRLLRPLKRVTHLASLARQPYRRARRSTGA